MLLYITLRRCKDEQAGRARCRSVRGVDFHGLGAATAFEPRRISFICPFREITGLRCPGCGNTNALLAIARCEFYDAYMCNPMFFPEAALAAAGVIYLSALYIKKSRPSKAAAAIFAGGAALILLWGIVRNIINI